MTKIKASALVISIFMVIAMLSFMVACSQSSPSPAPAPTITSAPAPATTAAPASTSVPVTTAAPATTTAASKTWNLRYAIDAPPSAEKSKANLAFAKSIEEATKGVVKVTLFAGATLCQASDTITATQNGIADIGEASTGVFPNVFPLTEVITLPFLGTNNAAKNGRMLWQLYQEFPEIQAEITGFKVLGLFSTDAYSLATNKPVRKLEDIKGLKLRTTGGPPTEMTKALGAVPSLVPMPDTYLALQKGVVDGLWYNDGAIISYRQYEVTKYVTDVPTCAVCFWAVMNKKTWDNFPPEVQKQMDSISGVKYAEQLGNGGFDAVHALLAAQLKKDNIVWPTERFTISTEEMQRWMDIGGKPIWDDWIKKYQVRGPTQKLIDRTLQLKQQNSQ